jgi:hypothetical protein
MADIKWNKGGNTQNFLQMESQQSSRNNANHCTDSYVRYGTKRKCLLNRGISIKCNILKKGDSYWGICLRSITYKRVSYYKKKLEPIAEHVIGEHLAGFRKCRYPKMLRTQCGLIPDMHKFPIDLRVWPYKHRNVQETLFLHFDIQIYITRLVRFTVTSTENQVRVQTEFTDGSNYRTRVKTRRWFGIPAIWSWNLFQED